jgi:TolB-like protein/AraC-like DNA-binding protein/Tfp pilus assembly protein PilF
MNLYLADDNEFIEQLSKIILENLNNGNFGVKELVTAAGINRNYLSHRIKSIKDTTVNQFINEVRLEKAREFLLEGTYTTAEISYNVGFSSPSYFTRCFHDHFGYPPGDIKKGTVNLSETKVAEGDSENINESKDDSKKIWKSKSVKHIYLPASIVVLAVMIFLSVYFVQNSSVSKQKTIAVLPFKNLSTNEENRYFADGVVEDILDRLAKISELKVVSRTSVEQFRESIESAPEIGKKLKVNYLLEGSVQRYDGKVRITIQLIDTKNDRHILSEKIDRDLQDILVLESDIAKLVADKLQAAISPEEKQLIEKTLTHSTEAYDYYLMGRYYWNQYYFENLLKSMEYFEKAINADSSFALAYAGLADIYYCLSGYTDVYPHTPTECYTKACQLAIKALQIDKNLPEAYAVLGIVYSNGYWNREQARKYFEKAMEIDSNNMVALFYYSRFLNIVGEFDNSRKYITRALEFAPYSIRFRRLSSYQFYQENNGEKALQEILLVEEMLGDKFDEQPYVIWCYLDAGDTVSALQLMQKTIETRPEYTQFKAYAYQIFPVFKSSGLTGIYRILYKFQPDYYLASQIDSIDAAIGYLEKAYENQVPNMDYLTLSRDFKKLHDDPRFLEIVDKVHLTPYFKKRYKK